MMRRLTPESQGTAGADDVNPSLRTGADDVT